MALTRVKLVSGFLVLTAFLIIVPLAEQSSAQKFASSLEAKCPCTQPQLVQRFWTLVTEEIYTEKNSSLDKEAKTELQKIIDRGSQRLVDEKAFDRLKEADKNMRKFCELAVKYARKDKRGHKRFAMTFAPVIQPETRVTGNNIQQAGAALCPLYPFC